MADKPFSPARITFDPDGVPFAEDFDDIYHSADGGPAQARDVFLAGNDLPGRWRGRRAYTVLETGFGLGLNFLCCCAELLADPAGPSRLNYVAVEKHPPRPDDLARAHRRWHALAAPAAELRSLWPPAVRGFHRLDLAAGRIGLTLIFGDAAPMLAELDARADALFLDGFAPSKNPAMWSETLFRELARLSGPGTTAATWSVAGPVRARLQQAGFAVEKRPGFGRKREMLAAVRPGAGPTDAGAVAAARHAVVIGAGLAGAWTAHALAARGWEVELVERHGEPAQEASGNVVGAVRPAFNLADNANARLARAAFLLTTRVLRRDAARHDLFRQTGVIHLAATAQQAERMAAILAAHAFPEDYVRWVDAEEAARRAQHRVAGPGWWIPDGGWARPQALCKALIGQFAHRIGSRFGSAAHDLTRAGSGWRVLDACGKVLAEAPVLVLANGYDAHRFGLPGMPGLVGVRGQVSFLPPAANRVLDIVVGGDGYVAPLPDGGHCIASTFEPGVEAADVRSADHASNLERAERMLPGFAAGADPARLAGWAGLRAATADRLPACGALDTGAGRDGDSDRYLVTGLGARGLIWAPLCAEVLASRLEREPNPVERSLVDAMDPLREFKRSRSSSSSGW